MNTRDIATCDHPGCTSNAVGKIGFDWYCSNRQHRPGWRPAPVVVEVAVKPPPMPATMRPTVSATAKTTPLRIYDIPRRKPWKAYNPTIKNPLPLVLRPNAGAHPELCRVDRCNTKIKARGLCDTHHGRASSEGVMDALALPSRQGAGGHNRKKPAALRGSCEG